MHIYKIKEVGREGGKGTIKKEIEERWPSDQILQHRVSGVPLGGWLVPRPCQPTHSPF